MRIAYISYEHPSGVSGGGIGTYIDQIASALAELGHEVEVFSASLETKKYQCLNFNNYLLHLIPTKTRQNFKNEVVPYFEEANAIKIFDIIESGEYGADGIVIKKVYPLIPMVLKLHTPSFLINKLNNWNLSLGSKSRFILGSLKKGNFSRPYWHYNNQNDEEYILAEMADGIYSPTESLAKIVKKKWFYRYLIPTIPNPFQIRDEIANVKHWVNTNSIVITFIGKLERRKGLVYLINAIPKVLKKYPNTIFRFVGKAHESPIKGMDMQQYAEKKLSDFQQNIDFRGFTNYDEIPEVLENSSICIFPSIWENFPNVCLEAMAAGRCVIGTNNGGMAEIIEHEKSGLLIAPKSVKEIENAMITLLNNHELIEQMGVIAKQTIAEQYNAVSIGKKTIAYYNSIIKKKENTLDGL